LKKSVADVAEKLTKHNNTIDAGRLRRIKAMPAPPITKKRHKSAVRVGEKIYG
jgi:hypothetical protein